MSVVFIVLLILFGLVVAPELTGFLIMLIIAVAAIQFVF